MSILHHKNKSAMDRIFEEHGLPPIFREELINHKNQSVMDGVFEEHGLTPNFRKSYLQELPKRCASSEEIAQKMIDTDCRLYQAAFTKNAKIVEFFIQKGLPINSVDPLRRTTALHIAVALEDVESVKVLIKYGIDVGAEDIEGLNSLSYVYKYNKEHTAEKILILQILLNRKATFAMRFTRNGTFQIEPTLVRGNSEAIRLILKSNVDFTARDYTGRNILHYLIRNTNFRIDEKLKSDIDYLGLNKLCRQGKCPSIAVINSNIEMVKFLLDQGVSSEEIAQEMIDTDCCLYQAAFTKNTKIMEYLIKRGLPMDCVHPLRKTTALHIAVALEDVESVKVLVKYDIDVRAVDIKGFNSLSYVYRYSVEDTAEKILILQILLNLEASVATTRTPNGAFQIKPTLVRGNFEAMCIILQSNINVIVKDCTGRNILQYLATNPNFRVDEKLKLHINKLDLNELYRQGRSPLNMALMNNNAEMVEFLLDHGVQVNCTDYKTCTPLYYACYKICKDRHIPYNVHKIPNPGFENVGNQMQIVDLLLEHFADPQNIFTGDEYDNDNPMTMFHCFNKLPFGTILSIVAHLAILEELGTPITKFICRKINLIPALHKHLKRYRRILTESIAESVTVLELLTVNEEKMVQHLSNKHLVLKLVRISYKQKVKYLFPYYWKVLLKRFSKGMEYMQMRNKAAVVISKIFENRLHKRDVIVDKIINYLNKQDVFQLYQLYKSIL